MSRPLCRLLAVALALAATSLRTAAAPEAPPAAASAPQVQPLPRQVIIGTSQEDGLFASRSSAAQLARSRSATGDTARLLQELPGVSLYSAGGVSSLPAVHGLADDRLRTQVDGMDLVAACPNHMNPGLSYIDPSSVGRVTVYAGISPVSVGGDSIGGTVQIEAAPPPFAGDGEAPLTQGRLTSFWRSNGHAHGTTVSASLATEQLSLGASTSTSRQQNYHAATAFKPAAPGSENGRVIPGDEVASSAYEGRNDEVRLAWRNAGHLLQLTLGRQHIGFEGFPNQRMDMTDNQSRQTNLRYTGQFDWGRLKARLWQQRVNHAMDMGPDRYFYGYGMPMLTEATTRGAQAEADVDVSDTDVLRVGLERQTYVLYDWWPPVGGSMGPNAFWNIDDGRRLRSAAFAEWEGRWSSDWTTLAGLRGDRVVTDAATVQGYDNGLGAIWGREAAAFNAARHRRQDTLLDLALTARYHPNAGQTYEVGLARKGHAPNLYQRYPWSTQPMAALMNNFVGDGNGYVGQPGLRPEIAHTFAANVAWQDAAAEDWTLKLAAYATHVRDFMDARRCDFGQCSAANVTAPEGFVLLQYANAPVRMHGLDLSGSKRLASGDSGTWDTAFVLAVLRGHNLATGDGLYNLMPDNLKLSLTHQRGGWTGSLELQAVTAKQRISRVRNEMTTPGYALVHLRASHEWPRARLDLAVDNLFNRLYASPLGGAYLGQGRSMTSAGIPWGAVVPGTGRSFNTSVSLWF
ncbi:TonB-dependent receptor [Roseateles cellulosilyticus]|uniref:TonB-dependent receptor plug domain-containing protein n=1 Tax=Pelomonas cellulosilytica TaxID=2906762 RepID=A0ABS8Y1G7_9BURK|nr:TonB-dependent receptor plug domain-containing protein [Pelomonas sp. P8]MCE4558158.1 TonB-dependent receptor plug domain-containing protein [Pelomonas sp. P8]